MSDLAGSTRRTRTQSARVAVIGGGTAGARRRSLAVPCFDTERSRSDIAVTSQHHDTMG